MAHLCTVKDESLAVLSLTETDGVQVRAGQDGEYTFRSSPAMTGNGTQESLILVPWQDSGKPRWALVCARGSAARVNGVPVLSGLRVLSHRDAISLNGAASLLFFLDEDPARPQPFPGSDKPVKCGLCKTPIEKGQTAVRCPGCGQWHHLDAKDKACWTYRKTCRSCGHSTSLDGTFSWTPAGL